MELQAQLQKLLQNRKLISPSETLTHLRTSYTNIVFSTEKLIIKLSSLNSKLDQEYIFLHQFRQPYLPELTEFFRWKNHTILIHKFLRGESADKIWTKLSPSKQKQTIKQLLKTLKQLHSLIPKNLSIFKIFQTSAINEIQQIWPNILENPTINSQLLKTAKSTFDQHFPLYLNQKNTLIHQDIWTNNIIIINNNNFAGFIDFETTIIGPPQIELFRLFHHIHFARYKFPPSHCDLKEIDFLTKTIKQIPTEYPQLLTENLTELFLIYNLTFYFRLLSRHKESWYTKAEPQKFYNELCTLEQCKSKLSLLHNLKST